MVVRKLGTQNQMHFACEERTPPLPILLPCPLTLKPIIVRTYRSHHGVTKNDLHVMASKLVEKVKKDKASVLEEQH